MVTRDVNHPSILFWDNGNEGGFNRELDGEFALYDPQNRAVLHPWEAFSGIDTKHYPPFDDLERRLHGPNLVMPTEVIHGIYDGGAGAGLEDYWNAIARSPFGAGLFLWVFADEGVQRTDEDGRIDVFSTFAPDGVLGPHHEKEGSFYTIRDLFSPVQVEAPVLDEQFTGTLAVHNRYDFTSLAQCRFLVEDPAVPGARGEGDSADRSGGGRGIVAGGGAACERGADARAPGQLARGGRARADGVRSRQAGFMDFRLGHARRWRSTWRCPRRRQARRRFPGWRSLVVNCGCARGRPSRRSVRQMESCAR